MTEPPARTGDTSLTPFENEVRETFGLVPNFFRTGAEAPGLIEQLWAFARSAYLDNPLPSLFKERLFVYLSRFCQVRYCIVRHVGFLIGHGFPAGDANAKTQTIEDVIELLRRPTRISDADFAACLTRLSIAEHPAIPAPGTQAETDVFAAANLLFLDPARGRKARNALAQSIGHKNLELLLALLAFIRTAHYWTVTHPDLALEDDMNQLLRDHEALAGYLLNDPEAENCQLSGRLFDELEQLRQERDDREALRAALAGEEQARKHQQVLIKELNHRVKNTLAVVQSIAAQTLRGSDTDPDVQDSLEGRLQALAGAHDLLTAQNWEGATLQNVIHNAVAVFAGGEQLSRIKIDGPKVELTPKQALAFSMTATELTTNAIKYGALSNDTGLVYASWTARPDNEREHLEFVWRESGGPPVAPPQKTGFGSRLINQVVPADLDGRAHLVFDPSGLQCRIDACVSGRKA